MISRLCFFPKSCLNSRCRFAKRPFNKEYQIQVVFRITFAMSMGTVVENILLFAICKKYTWEYSSCRWKYSKGIFKLPGHSWKRVAADEMQNCKRELWPRLLCISICISWHADVNTQALKCSTNTISR